MCVYMYLKKFILIISNNQRRDLYDILVIFSLKMSYFCEFAYFYHIFEIQKMTILK